MGNVAMMPREKIIGLEIEKGKPVDCEAYLIEARSIGGLSGSPAFVCETLKMEGAAVASDEHYESSAYFYGSFFSLGLMHGHWDVKEQDFNEVEVRPIQNDPQGVNMGIAVVVPAKKILEIITDHPALISDRLKAERIAQKEMGAAIKDHK
jgi:hypothetical protein